MNLAGTGSAQTIQDAYPYTSPKTYGYASHNVYEGFPPLMRDGRAFGSYDRSAVTNQAIIRENGIQTNWEYRRYLQTHGTEIQRMVLKEAENDSGHLDRLSSIHNPARMMGNVPFKYGSLLDDSQPFGYEYSDLKQGYLTREQLNDAKMGISIPDVPLNEGVRPMGI
jgi:hypothetical protein